MTRLNSTTFLAGMMVGFAVGAMAALLAAPRPGYGYTSLRDRRRKHAEGPLVDEAIEESFPASDPPSWSSATTGVGAS
jgi:gas vesicle protein